LEFAHQSPEVAQYRIDFSGPRDEAVTEFFNHLPAFSRR
jgi:hypothetical protein